MKALLKKIKEFLEKNTSGFPFILWSVFSASVAIFVVIFRDSPFIDFKNLKVIFFLGAVWFIGSDIIKSRKIINLKFQLISDACFYILLFNLIVYFTGGVNGGLLVVLIAAVISAPFFFGNLGSLIFVLTLSLSVLLVHLFSHDQFNPYQTGVLLIHIVCMIIIAVMIRYFLQQQEKIKNSRIAELSSETEFKNQELQRTLEELNKNRETLKDKVERLEKFQKLVVDRELKMIELKEKIRDLETGAEGQKQ